MSNISIKKDFQDGNILPASDLNNNFRVIEAGINANDEQLEQVIENAILRLDAELIAITADRGWDWNGGERVTFFKGTTNQVNNQSIKNGQLLYNVDTGETAVDSGNERINTGSGNVVAITTEEPENPATKLWIDPTVGLQNVGTEVVNSIEGNQTTKAPSVNAVKNNVLLQQLLPAGTNIDNLTVIGVYSIFNAMGTLPSGYSTSDNNIFIENLMWKGEGLSWGRQMLHDIRSNRSFTRNKRNGVWYAWYEITDEITSINLLEANDNGTIVKQKFYKQGKHIWGDALVKGASNFSGSYQYPCKLIYDYPSTAGSDLTCVLCYGEFTAEGIGYMYITPNQKRIMISDTTGGNDKQYAKIHLDFVLN